MNRRLLPFAFVAALTAARAELPIDLPPEPPTDRPVPGIHVPALLGTSEPTNAITQSRAPGHCIINPPETNTSTGVRRNWEAVRPPAGKTKTAASLADRHWVC